VIAVSALPKVLHVTQSGGGVARAIETLVGSSVAASHSIVAPLSAFSPIQRSRMNARFIECNMVRNINPLSDLKSLISLIRILSGEDYDILHLHSSKAGMLGRLAAVISKNRGTPVIFSPHGWSFHPNMNIAAHRTFVTLERLTCRLADVIVCVSDSELEYGRSHGIVPSKRMLRIYNGVNALNYQPAQSKSFYRESLGIPQNSFVYVVNARIARGKSPLEIIRAFSIVLQEFPDSYLVYVGDGPLRKELQDLTTNLGLDQHVRHTGWVDDVRPFLWSADASILITQWEAFGLAVVESLACGIPCVVSSVGPMKEIINDSVGVFVNDYLNPEAISVGMKEVRRKTFDHEKCVATAQRFSSQRMSEEYDKLYQEIMNDFLVSDPKEKGPKKSHRDVQMFDI
jgi:glycosyltransferase involved in cell wall biosynthesis